MSFLIFIHFYDCNGKKYLFSITKSDLEFRKSIQNINPSTEIQFHQIEAKIPDNIEEKDFPNTALAANASFSLPLYNGMTNKEINYVVDVIKQYFN